MPIDDERSALHPDSECGWALATSASGLALETSRQFFLFVAGCRGVGIEVL